MENSSPDVLTMSIQDACRVVGFSRAKMYREINSRRLPVRKAGYRTLVLMSDLKAYIDALPPGGPSEAKP